MDVGKGPNYWELIQPLIWQTFTLSAKLFQNFIGHPLFLFYKILGVQNKILIKYGVLKIKQYTQHNTFHVYCE
jgi:hypothetical protein